tara:strand:+ start:834 stop:1727 length:894 start_codon:yes stop_codon:yes gene_type:complete
MNSINETHDLDIDNYNLTDLLNLFHLQFDFNENDLKRAKLMVYKMHPDKSNIDNKYFIFFNKAYKTIQKVYYFKRKKQQNSYDTEYSYLNNNVKKDEKLLAKKLQGKSVKDFNNWFNKMFEKTRMKDNSSEGYENWFRSEEDTVKEKASSLNDFDRLFRNKKEKCRELAIKKDLEEITTSNEGYDLNRKKPENYSSGIFSKLQYEDLKKAHTETVVPVTQEDYYNKEKYKNVHDMKLSRSKQNIVPLSKEDSNVILNRRRYNTEEVASNLAYDLLKQEEEAKRLNEKWWRNLKQLEF